MATPANATTASPSNILLIMRFLPYRGSLAARARCRKRPAGASLPLDPLKTRRDAPLEQRPVEAERERHVATLDHPVGLLGRACDAADRNAALEDACLGARHQIKHFRVVGQAAL